MTMRMIKLVSSFVLAASMAMAANFPQIAVTQNVTADSSNSSTNNIAVNAGFVGTSASTLGIAGIQVSIMADKNLTVFIQQSPDSTNWDLSDAYNYIATKNFGITVQAISSFYRVIVTNISASATTYLRMQTALCPIVEAVPRSLDVNGNLKVGIQSINDGYGWSVENTAFGEMRTIEPYRLIGASFGEAIDTNYWLVVTNFSPSVVWTNGTVSIPSGTNSGNYSVVYSARRARWVTGTQQRFRGVYYVDFSAGSCIRRWGVCNPQPASITDGAWFLVSNGVFGVATMLNGVSTIVTNGSFNGYYGATAIIATNKINSYEIYWYPVEFRFVINGYTVHSVGATTVPMAATLSFYLFNDSTNYAAVATSKSFNPWTANIFRLGKEDSQPAWRRITTASGVVLKNSPGRLRRITVNSTTGGSSGFTIYDTKDGTAANTIAAFLAPANSWVSLDYNIDFYNGLSITTSGTIDLTAIFE